MLIFLFSPVVHRREMDDQISADLKDEVCIQSCCNVWRTYWNAHFKAQDFIFVLFDFGFFFLQDEITEDDIDDSFKSMFAQLAGEVRFPLLGIFVCNTILQLTLYYSKVGNSLVSNQKPHSLKCIVSRN